MESYKAEWSHILSHPRTQRLIELAVEEDLEDQGDVTSDPIFPPLTTLEPFSVLEKMRLCVASRFMCPHCTTLFHRTHLEGLRGRGRTDHRR